MKVTHKYTLLKFDVDGVEYTVYCPAGKRGNNCVHIYDAEGKRLKTHCPQGGNVNKTKAATFLRDFLNKEPYITY